MNSSTLKNMLIEYERKKANAEHEADIKKQELFKKVPVLQEIENQLTSLAISTTKVLIQNNDTTLLEDLKKQIEDLKRQKIDILKKLQSLIKPRETLF